MQVPTGGALTSVQDRARHHAVHVSEHLRKIAEAHGAVVPDLGSRNGRRAELARENVGLSTNWGGRREKGVTPDDAWYHPLATTVRARNIAASVGA